MQVMQSEQCLGGNMAGASGYANSESTGGYALFLD